MNNGDVIHSLHNRCASLEDIIRQQEQTIAAVLTRLRDVEQHLSNESRARDGTQQQIQSLTNDRSATAAQIDGLSNIIGNQGDRLSSVEAGHQGLLSAVQGVDQKYDAVSRGLESRLQGDIQAVQQRLQASEQATAEAIRSAQSGIQGNTNAIQTVDNNTRASLEGLHQQISTEVNNVRQRVEQLEGSVRDALRDLHGSVSNDIQSANRNMENLLQTAVKNQNDALLAFDQRVRGEMTQLNTQEQNDAAALRQRIEEIDNHSRQAIQSAQTNLGREINEVSQVLQALDSRQRAAHQDLIQELSKHDQQMETIDVNWRASVMDLSGKVDADHAMLLQQFQAADANLQSQLNGLQDRFVMVSEEINRNLNDVVTTVQERCVVPLEITNGTVTRHGERLTKLAEDGDSVREFLRVFSQEVDKNTQELQKILENAIRTSHTDLLERINVVSAATALHADPDQVYTQINEALTAIWGDVSSTFTTQRDLGGLQSQMATLESAIRTEIVAMAQRNNELQLQLAELEKRTTELEPPPNKSATGGLSSSVSSRADHPSPPPSTQREVVPTVKPAVSAEGELERAKTVEREIEKVKALSEAELEKVKTLAGEAAESAQAAEEAQNRCVKAVNQGRSLLEEVASIRDSVWKQKEEMYKFVREQRKELEMESNKPEVAPLAAPTAVPTADRAGSAGEPKLRKKPSVSNGYPPLYAAGESAAPRQIEPAERRSSDIQRISGTFNKNDFLVRPSPLSQQRASETSIVFEDGRASPSEILLPTHQFVRKKEFASHKSYIQNEFDGLWKELLALKKRSGSSTTEGGLGGGVSREEVLLMESETKEEVTKRTTEILARQEREFKQLLELIRRQVAMLYSRLFPEGGDTEWSALERNIQQSSNFAAAPAEPRIHSAPAKPEKPATTVANERKNSTRVPPHKSVAAVLLDSSDDSIAMPVEVYRPPHNRTSTSPVNDPRTAQSSQPPHPVQDDKPHMHTAQGFHWANDPSAAPSLSTSIQKQPETSYPSPPQPPLSAFPPMQGPLTTQSSQPPHPVQDDKPHMHTAQGFHWANDPSAAPSLSTSIQKQPETSYPSPPQPPLSAFPPMQGPLTTQSSQPPHPVQDDKPHMHTAQGFHWGNDPSDTPSLSTSLQRPVEGAYPPLPPRQGAPPALHSTPPPLKGVMADKTQSAPPSQRPLEANNNPAPPPHPYGDTPAQDPNAWHTGVFDIKSELPTVVDVGKGNAFSPKNYREPEQTPPPLTSRVEEPPSHSPVSPGSRQQPVQVTTQAGKTQQTTALKFNREIVSTMSEAPAYEDGETPRSTPAHSPIVRQEKRQTVELAAAPQQADRFNPYSELAESTISHHSEGEEAERPEEREPPKPQPVREERAPSYYPPEGPPRPLEQNPYLVGPLPPTASQPSFQPSSLPPLPGEAAAGPTYPHHTLSPLPEGPYRFPPGVYSPTPQLVTANLLRQVDELERQILRMNLDRLNAPRSAPAADRGKEFMNPITEQRKNPIASQHHLAPMEEYSSSPRKGSGSRTRHSAPEVKTGRSHSRSAPSRRPSQRNGDPFDPLSTQSYPTLVPVDEEVDNRGMSSSPAASSDAISVGGTSSNSRKTSPVNVRVLSSSSDRTAPSSTSLDKPTPSANAIRIPHAHPYRTPVSAPAPIRVRTSKLDS